MAKIYMHFLQFSWMGRPAVCCTEKEAYKGRPNASTTKVMTCILALELAKGDDYVQVSGNAASQPQTRLGMREGQQFYLEDLLYSLMLKSHNDSAVAIAEPYRRLRKRFCREDE